MYILLENWTPPKELRGNTRVHWTVRKKWAARVRALGKEAGERSMERQGITEPIKGDVEVMYWFHLKRDRDVDNDVFGMKSILDGLADAGAILNDKQVVRVTATKLYPSRLAPAVEVRVAPASIAALQAIYKPTSKKG